MSDENKTRYRSFKDDVLNSKNPDTIDNFMAPEFQDHNPPPGFPPGLAGLKQMMTMFFSAFPDLKITTDDLIAEGDMVVGRHTTTGTHKGDFMGIAATGKQVKINEIHWVRTVGGKAVEHWGLSDDLSMMTQLGVIPAPGEGG